MLESINDYDSLRERMVDLQLKSRGIKDKKVLKVMQKVKRHLFVSENQRDRAYNDSPLPIGDGQTISQPYMVAIMTEFLALKGGEKVLEIGTGSGYQTAIIAEIAQFVYTIDRLKKLIDRTREVLITHLGYKNIFLKAGDGTLGWREFAPYDRIIVTAAAPEIPEPLIEQLKNEGIMVVPTGSRYSQILSVVWKDRKGKIKTKEGIPCIFVPLIGKYGWKNG